MAKILPLCYTDIVPYMRQKKKYENIYVMNYSFVDCEKMEYVAKMITQVE